jgi:Flp pilus assembly protein TadB
MSKEKARRRAEDRAKKRAPKPRGDAAQRPARQPTSKKRRRTAREERQRRRLWVIAGLWLVANALIWVFTDTWNARWFGLTITTIAVPLIVWLVWDPERRVHL